MTRKTLIGCACFVMALFWGSPATVANAAVQATLISTATYPLAVDVDDSGNIWIGYANGPMTPKGVTVVPAASGTIFGVPVTAGVETRIFDIDAVQGIQMSGSGELFVATDKGGQAGLLVATTANTTVFGVPTTANTLTPIPGTEGVFKGGIAIDSAGNIFGGRKAANGIAVLPVGTGTLYGEAVVANTPKILMTSPDWSGDVAIDSSDNLFIGTWFGPTAADEGVSVLPKATGTVYGQAVVQDTLIQIVSDRYVAGVDIDDSDNLYFSQWSFNRIQALSPATRTLFGEAIPANTPTVLTGSNGQANQGVAVSPTSSFLASGGNQTVKLTAVQAPTISSITPSSGLIEGGTVVTISGSSLTATSSVTFGGVAGANLVVIDDSTLTVSTPAAAVGPVDVTVTTPGGSVTSPAGFTYVAPEPPPPIPAGPPGDVAAAPGDSSALVLWAPPTSRGSFPVSNYQVRSTPGSAGCLVPAATTSCVLGELRNGVEYEVRVRALTGAGWGAWSESVSVVPEPPAPEPSIMIRGSREGGAVVVQGVTTGLVGEQVTPWVRFPGPYSYEAGTGVRTVGENGTFTWQRQTRKKIYVYFRAEDDVRSNRVIIRL